MLFGVLVKRARFTIRDVARQAGVLRRNVLRVINGDPLAAREACARVEAATSEPGCQSNAIARSLAAGRTHTLACLAPNLTDYTFARTSEGAEARFRQHGFSSISTSEPGEATVDHSPIHGAKIDEGRWSTQW